MLDLLRNLTEEFHDNPAASGEALRQLLAGDGPGFFAAALSLLRDGADSPGRQFLVRMLAENDKLLEPLCLPGVFTLPTSVSLARLLIVSDPRLDIKLARKLPELQPPSAERALAILEALDAGPRVVPMLASALRHSSARLRSKAALMIGRIIQKPDWSDRQFQDPDPRVRANLVESLWGADSPAARELFWKAAGDGAPRVAANAVLGLYRLGEPAAIRLIRSLALRPEPGFRQSAAWAIGQTTDPRFESLLLQMNRDPEASVGVVIDRAVQRIRAAEEPLKRRARLLVRILRAEELENHKRRLIVAVDRPVLAIEIAILENSEMIWDYAVRPHQPAEPLVLGFALCWNEELSRQHLAFAREGVRACLRQKRPADLWALMTCPHETVRYSADSAALRKALATPEQACSDSAAILEGLRWMLDQAPRLRGDSNLILPAGAVPAARDLAAAALAAKTAVHMIGAGAYPSPNKLEELCRRTGGAFAAGASSETIPVFYRQIYSSLLNRYELSYRPEVFGEAGAEQRVCVQVHSERGFGEDATALGAGGAC